MLLFYIKVSKKKHQLFIQHAIAFIDFTKINAEFSNILNS